MCFHLRLRPGFGFGAGWGLAFDVGFACSSGFGFCFGSGIPRESNPSKKLATSNCWSESANSITKLGIMGLDIRVARGPSEQSMCRGRMGKPLASKRTCLIWCCLHSDINKLKSTSFRDLIAAARP